MSGDRARRGFTHQDRYLIKRVLHDIASTVDLGKATGIIFGLESRGQENEGSDGPKWDVVVSTTSSDEVIEVKSGAIPAEERRVFWSRIRREANRRDESRIIPKLVCDPTRAGNLSPWEGLVDAVARFEVDTLRVFEGNVTSAETMCAEAMDYLCRRELSSDSPPLGFENARSLLQRFKVETEIAEDLKKQVDQGIELFLPNGITDSTRQHLQGWLFEKATDPDESARKFSSQDVISTVASQQACLSLNSGEMETWKRFWTDLPTKFRAKANARLGKSGPTIGVLEGQPLIGPTLLDLKQGGAIALGKGGGGKSALSLQIADESGAHDPEGVMAVAADDLTPTKVESFCNSIRFRKGLRRLKQPDFKLTLIVDALDETESELREEWVKSLSLLAQENGLLVLVTMREGVWQTDNKTQGHLGKFQRLDVADWPESLVVSQVSGVLPQIRDYPGLLTLLRQPLMLDIFWRTFVDEPDSLGATDLPVTRHQLFSRFWQKRISQSTRYRLELTAGRVDHILGSAACSLEPFEVVDGDLPGVDALVSESVLLRDGQLIPKLRFRHLLLRDFALSLWCLRAGTSAEVISRWQSIEGGLRRNGALRAMLDAISDLTFETEFAYLPFTELLSALLGIPEGQDQLAQVLGKMNYRTGLDPNFWPPSIQSSLSPSFGRQLVTYAETHHNTSWAQGIQSWQANLGWLDPDFAKALYSYTGRSAQLLQGSNDAQLKINAISLARKLREISEQPRFEEAFAYNRRHLKMFSITKVVPLLPDLESLEWVEREMEAPSFFTRSWSLEVLIYLAAVDSARAANIYRQAVGLQRIEGRWQLGYEGNERAQESMTLDQSLGAIDGHRSLIYDYPAQFAPLAVQMAEATNEVEAPVIDGIVDDAWNFWGLSGHSLAHRYLSILKKKALELAEMNPALFLSSIPEAIAPSRLLSAHSVFLDALYIHRAKHGFMDRLVELLKEPRLYRFPTIGYWMQNALETVWPVLSPTDKEIIFRHLKDTETGIDKGRRHAGRLALSIPGEELVSPLKEMAAEQRGEPGSAYPDLGERDHIYSVPMPDEEAYAYFLEDWSPAWPHDHLAVLARSSSDINRQSISQDDLRAELAQIGNSIMTLLPVMEENRAEFFSADAYKLVERIELWLKLSYQRRLIVASPELIQRLAEMTMTELETAEYAVGAYVQDLNVIHASESSWSRALGFMTLLFAFVPARSDEGLRRRFTEVVRGALTQGDKHVQALVAHEVDHTHWKSSPERLALYEELLWSTARDPLVTNATFQSLLRMPEDMQARSFRVAFEQSPQNLPKTYAGRLGRALGLATFYVRELEKRTIVAQLTDEIIGNADQFVFLQPAEVRQECFHEMGFGFSEQIEGRWFLPGLAADYARWMLEIWRYLKGRRHTGHQSEQIVSSVFFQLKEAQKTVAKSPSKENLKSLWDALRPFATAIAHEGARSDLFNLFLTMRNADFKSIIPNNDLFDFVRVVLDRLQNGVANHALDLDERDTAHDDHFSWSEALSLAAETLGALSKHNLLRNDLEREKSHGLLSRLAGAPFNITSAATALGRLQTEGI